MLVMMCAFHCSSPFSSSTSILIQSLRLALDDLDDTLAQPFQRQLLCADRHYISHRSRPPPTTQPRWESSTVTIEGTTKSRSKRSTTLSPPSAPSSRASHMAAVCTVEAAPRRASLCAQLPARMRNPVVQHHPLLPSHLVRRPLHLRARLPMSRCRVGRYRRRHR